MDLENKMILYLKQTIKQILNVKEIFFESSQPVVGNVHTLCAKFPPGYSQLRLLIEKINYGKFTKNIKRKSSLLHD